MRSLRGLNLIRAGHQKASPCCSMETGLKRRLFTLRWTVVSRELLNDKV
ncbi:MAG: hypothetical protein KDJ28_08730 [Candidatus Competibacteraceae bacterium]|nr:hypothetical protein [Candidatus Competibacteraceae bacterium]